MNKREYLPLMSKTECYFQTLFDKNLIMKKVLFFSVCLLFVLSGISQEIKTENVPAIVRKAFVKQFPLASSVKYSVDGKDYQVSFLLHDKAGNVTYSSSGNLIETQREIEPSALPKAVSAAAAKNFPGFTIVTAVKREAIDKGICYEMDVKKDDGGYSVRFSETGEILQKIARKVQFKVTTKSTKK